ncbi:MAG: hypothetical protein NUV91_05785 [Candidatus Omnitrophica bacterium]|nr:hypothetical protein [Candidatus Omnitrophota bacterium]
MQNIVRVLLTPVTLAMFFIGFITGHWLIYGIIGAGLLIISFLLYSGRKQRVRYWIQGYKKGLKALRQEIIDVKKEAL